MPATPDSPVLTSYENEIPSFLHWADARCHAITVSNLLDAAGVPYRDTQSSSSSSVQMLVQRIELLFDRLNRLEGDTYQPHPTVTRLREPSEYDKTFCPDWSIRLHLLCKIRDKTLDDLSAVLANLDGNETELRIELGAFAICLERGDIFAVRERWAILLPLLDALEARRRNPQPTEFNETEGQDKESDIEGWVSWKTAVETFKVELRDNIATDDISASAVGKRISKACGKQEIKSKGRGHERLIDRDSLMAYCLKIRDRALLRDDMKHQKDRRGRTKNPKTTYLPEAHKM